MKRHGRITASRMRRFFNKATAVPCMLLTALSLAMARSSSCPDPGASLVVG